MPIACGAIAVALAGLAQPIVERSDPVVTLVTDDNNARLERIDLDPTSYVVLKRAQKRSRERYAPPNPPTIAICTAPCGVQVPGQHVYRIDGPGLTPSRDFTIPSGEAVTVRTRTGSLPLVVTGVSALVAGFVGVLVGGVLVASSNPETAHAGRITMGVSAGVAAISFPLILFGRTSVDVEKTAK
jgi:hypothetical protein